MTSAPVELIEEQIKEEKPAIEIKLIPIIEGVEEDHIMCTFTTPILRIGRVEDNDIILPIETASRYHANLTFEGRNVFIEDLKSSHGTFIGQMRLEPFKKYKLKNGDLIRFSMENSWYEVCLPEDEVSFSNNDLDSKPSEMDSKQKNLDFAFVQKSEQSVNRRSKWEVYQSLLNEKVKPKAITKVQSFDWGMIDDDDLHIVNDEEKVLNPQILRLLPNLSDEQLGKITKFEKSLKQLHKLETELDTLEQQTGSQPESTTKFDNPLYFESEETNKIVMKDSNSKSGAGTYKMWELKQTISKKLSELSLMEEQLKSSIFGKAVGQSVILSTKSNYEENLNMIDQTSHQRSSLIKSLKEADDKPNDPPTTYSQDALKGLLQKKLFAEEALISSSIDGTVNKFDLLDDYEAFLAENKEVNKQERQEHLLNDLKRLEGEISNMYAVLKKADATIESLDRIEQKTRAELEQVILFIKRKQKINQFATEHKPEAALAEDIDEIDCLDDEEEIRALNKRRQQQALSLSQVNQGQSDKNKKVKRIGVANNVHSEDQLIEYKDDDDSQNKIGYSPSEQSKVEEYFKKLGY